MRRHAWMNWGGAVMAGIVTALAAGCGQRSERIILRLGHGLDVTHPVHQGMVRMKERLEELSGGRATIEIFPNEQLGSERTLLEQVQMGCIDMVKVSASALESFMPEIGAINLPYVFRDEGHYFRVLDGDLGRRILESGHQVGLQGLCFYDAGSRSFYTRDRPINKPGDLKGLKIRVQPSPISIQMVNSFGGSATPVNWGELYTALQQGIVDGAENNPPSVVTARHYEVCKYYSLNEHTRVPDVLMISYERWQRLPEDLQKMLLQAARDSAVYQRELWAKDSQECLDLVKSKGMEILRPDPKPFAEASQSLRDSFKGTKLGELVDEIQRIP